ncbi:MAG: META domain-containing protein [Acidimicrobiia bacterium]
MDSQVKGAFEVLMSEMEDPPDWEDLSSIQTLVLPKRSSSAGPMVAVAAAVITIVAVGLVGLIRPEGEPTNATIGVWQLDRYILGGQRHNVVAGVNAVSEPWVIIDAESMTGHAGCNAFAGRYQYLDDAITSDPVKNAAWCGPDDGTLMEAELAFEAMVWQEGSVTVSFDGNRMIWSNGGNALEWVSIASPPTTQFVAPPPINEVGRLDCSPGVVAETRVPDEGQEVLDIAQEADPNVVEVEHGEPLRYSGLNADGQVIVEIALGDMSGADYQVWACSN